MQGRKIWFIADTHFNHKNIIELDGRSNDYQEQIIDNWFEMVWLWDTVIVLWDVIFSRKSELDRILAWLPGIKILVKGNHDNELSNWYLQRWFHLVVDRLEMSKKWKKFTCTHKPDLELKEWQWNIHWHLHKNNHRDAEFEWLLTDKHILINFKSGYKPILLDDII